MVALGTLASATWILASNSWMQTPAGYEIIGGRVVPTDWLAVIFNPSFPYLLVHMVLAAFLSTALMVAASAAWHLLRGRDSPAIRKMLSMAMGMLLVAAPIQVYVGDAHGLNTLKHQPAKIAAMEGHWENEPGAGVPLILFGWPDMEREAALGKAISSVLKGSGRLKQSVADSSFDAWTKYYRQDENAPNAIVSYYAKGSLIALALDLQLRLASGGERSLDDLMRTLWQEHGLTGVGVAEDGLYRLTERLGGKKLARWLEQIGRAH